MVKFIFYIKTPRGGHYNMHYAKTKVKAKAMVKQWNEEFRDSGYGVRLIRIDKASKEEVPVGYTVW